MTVVLQFIFCFVYIYVFDRKAIELAKDDTKQLYSCLLTYIDIPKEYHSKIVIDDLINKLSNIKNSRVDQVLGKYYLKHEKVCWFIIVIKNYVDRIT